MDIGADRLHMRLQPSGAGADSKRGGGKSRV